MPPQTEINILPDELIINTMKKLSLKNRIRLSETSKYFKQQFDENFKTLKYYFKKGIATKQITRENFEDLTLQRLTERFWRPRRNSIIPGYIRIVDFNFHYQTYRGTITTYYDAREFDDDGNDIQPSIKFVKFQCREFEQRDNILLTLSRKKPDDFQIEYKVIDHPNEKPDKERSKELLFILLAAYEKCRAVLKNRRFYGQNVAIPDIEHKHKYLSLYKNPIIQEIFSMTYKHPSQSTPKSSSVSS